MEKEAMIPVNEFCIHYNIELSFIDSLKESGLIDIKNVEEEIVIPLSQLNQLEKIARLYYEMDINLEGIETITYLLKRMNAMQQEIVQLSNKLSVYENE